MPTAPVTGKEVELVSPEDGKRLAEAWKREPRELDIPNTLLSSQHITGVVTSTGAIAPFFISDAPKSRLKKAAYEGRIGSRAFIFEDSNSPVQIFDATTDAYLKVPRNSIVFVESDLDFRVPDFIALRFNLQIQHVHRGLLLGTGPLVDPGFWGKLCIPLHNLTDQDYEIPRDEGLIWVEFTKTTLSAGRTDPARAPSVTTDPKGEGHWDITVFLNKAASQYRSNKVPIRSSLPTMFAEANSAAAASAADAKSVAEATERLKTLNTIAFASAFIGLGSLGLASTVFLSNLSARNEDLAVKIRDQTEVVQKELEQHLGDVDLNQTAPVEIRTAFPALRKQLLTQRSEIDGMKLQIKQMQLEMKRQGLERGTAHAW